tara:strand:+ start:177 stop:824 length:648 start_codon:yes stop_codon:yes gene_type:complete
MVILKHPILYSFRRCPYAMRARFSIRISQIKIELREVILKKKPKDFLKFSNDGTVPILIQRDNTTIQESLDIVFWALKFNKNLNELKKIDNYNFLKFCDTEFKHNLDRYKYPTRYENVDPNFYRNKNIKFLKLLNKKLSLSKFLLTDKLSFLDFCIFPFIRQYRNVDQLWFNHLNLSYLNDWFSFIVESQEFDDIMKKYKVWEPSDSPLITNFKN